MINGLDLLALWLLPDPVFPCSSVVPPFALLVIRLKPSKRLALALTLAHFTATILLWPLALPIEAKLAGSILLAASLVFYLKSHVWLSAPQSISGFELSDEMTCTLETRQGERIVCALLGRSFVAPYLTVLELKPLELPSLWQRLFSSRSVVILPDAIDPEEFRQLRVLLRWKWKDPNGKK